MADQLTPSADKSVRARRFQKCGPLMEALEKCHARGMLINMLGTCNRESARVAECFHEERLERSHNQVVQSRKVSAQSMKEVHAARAEEAAAKQAIRIRKAREQAAQAADSEDDPSTSHA